MQLLAFVRKYSDKILLILFLTFVFIIFIHPIQGDGDIFHHLNTGRWILEHKQLPQTDAWTFTVNGKPWIANAWGGDVIFYSTYSIFGYGGLSILFSLVGVLTFLLLYIWLKTYKVSNNSIFISLGFAAAVVSTRWPNRPELITYPFLITVLLLDRLKIRFPKVILLYPLLLFAWSILYGSSVFVGIVFLGVICLKQFFDDKYKIKQPYLYISSLISLILIFFNGYGLKNIFYILLIPNIRNYLGEWNGILFNIFNISEAQILVEQYKIALFLLYFIIFLTLILKKYKNATKYKFLTIISFGILLPFLAIRNIPLAIILSLPLFAIFLPNRKKVITAILFIFLFLSIWTNEHGIGINKNSFSPSLIQFFKQNEIGGNVFVNQDYGSYLSYELFPKVLVYTDTRDDLFVGTKVLSDYYKITSSNKNIIPLINKYKVSAVVADSTISSYEPLVYSNDWALVYVDDSNLVFVKKEIAEEKNLKQYIAIDPYANDYSKTGLQKQAIAEYKYILSKTPDSFNVRLYLAQSYLNLKEYGNVINIANQMQVSGGVGEAIYKYKKDFFLASSYLLSNNCPIVKQYIDNYSNDLSHKFLFNPLRKIDGYDEEQYVIYYLVCNKDAQQAQEHLNNILSNSNLSSGRKQEAQRIFNQLAGN